MNKSTATAAAKATPTPAAQVFRRQCACGNHTSSGECENCAKKKVQRKLSIGASNDPLEQEADYVAEQVLGNNFPGVFARPLPIIQRHAEQATGASDAVPHSVERAVSGTGRSLPPLVQKDMETRFGHDFSQVRIHTSEAAAHSARDIQASAYTLGNHIVFNSGKFTPSNTEGKRLLAHELTHVIQQSGASGKTIARAPDPKAPTNNFTPQQQTRLEQARINQKADGTRIVGVLLTPDGNQYEFISGGPGRFYAHIEGKAVAKMNELGVQRGVLLVEKEPCQTCDRSTYTYDPLKPTLGGPEVPLRSSKTGEPLARSTSMINSGLHRGSVLKVIDPVSSGIYYGLKTPPPKATGSGSLPPVGLTGTSASNPSSSTNATLKDATANAVSPGSSLPLAPAPKTSAALPAPSKPPAAPTATSPAKLPVPVAPVATKPPAAGERQRFSTSVPSVTPPITVDTSKGQAKAQGAILAIQGVLAILTYFADKHQRARADAGWAEAYPRIQEEVTRTGLGVVVYIEYSQNQGSTVLIFEGVHWSSGGQDPGRPGSIRAPGQSAVFARSYVGPTEAQAAISDESALIFRRDEARTKQRDLQNLAEILAKEGWLGRKLRERAGDSISALSTYDAKAHIASASQSIKDKRYTDAAASLDKAEAALDDMWAQIKAYVGEQKLKELRGEH